MHYLLFEQYSNRLESLELRGVGSNPRRGNFFLGRKTRF
jgi:hypothetical protein